MSAVDRPASDLGRERRVPHSSHWGAFTAVGDGRTLTGVEPHPDDPAPSPLLDNIAAAVTSPARVAQPVVRRGWWEDGPGPTDRRGNDGWVAPGWDAVLDRLAGELRRVYGRDGPEGVYGGSYGWSSAGRFHHAQSQLHRFLNQLGGYVRSVNTYSLGASAVLLPHVVGDAEHVLRQATPWDRIAAHTELLVSFGGLPERTTAVNPGGVTRHTMGALLRQGRQRGLTIELFSPLGDDVADDLGATWHPLRPGTDTAVMLGLLHVLFDEGLADLAFLERYCVGHERLRAYVEGRAADGVAKTPEWAAAIAGLDADELRRLARRMAACRTMVAVAWALQRARYGEQPVWAGIALAAALGQIGLPGGGFGHGYGSMADVGEAMPMTALPTLGQGANPVRAFIPVARVADMLLHPGEPFEYDGGVHRYPTVHLVYWAGGNPFHHHQDLNRLRRALGRPDTVVVQEPFWTPMAHHADIVLPATTTLERDDIGAGRKDRYLHAMYQAVEPVGEARDDHAILAGLAQRLGVADRFTEGRDERQWLAHLYDTWRHRIAHRYPNLPSFEQFWADGQIRLPDPEPPDGTDLFAAFRADPEAHRLGTPSGRIELWSATVAGFGYDDCPGHPAWLEPEEWLGNAGTVARFPLHLIANQPASRLHSQLDMGATSAASKVRGREPLRLHPDDARARGLADGDVARVFNDRGACLAGVVVSDMVRPGVAQLATGAWYDPDDPTLDRPLCVHGNPNVVTADVGTSRLAQGSTGQHALVEVERWDGLLPPIRAHQPPAI